MAGRRGPSRKPSAAANRTVATYGLTHVALRVADPLRSAEFYGRIVGARVTYHDPDHVEVQTPSSHDAIAFMRSDGPALGRARESEGMAHFGFRLRRPGDVRRAAELLRDAGATDIRTGEFLPGEPYVFARDPDGYEVEVWFEPVARPAKR